MAIDKDIELTGEQVRFIREYLDESQETFAKRFRRSQPVVFRMENKGNELLSGPEIILIKHIADENSIVIPPADQAVASYEVIIASRKASKAKPQEDAAEEAA